MEHHAPSHVSLGTTRVASRTHQSTLVTDVASRRRLGGDVPSLLGPALALIVKQAVLREETLVGGDGGALPGAFSLPTTQSFQCGYTMVVGEVCKVSTLKRVFPDHPSKDRSAKS